MTRFLYQGPKGSAEYPALDEAVDKALDRFREAARLNYPKELLKERDQMARQLDQRFAYLNHLEPICVQDVEELTRKDISYGSSWKKRGGVGAFMMLARKWDRLEEMVKDGYGYDIFAAIGGTGGGGEDGTILAEIRDLRRYLLLVEAEMIERGVVPEPPSQEEPSHQGE
jgi:hypothetical protein